MPNAETATFVSGDSQLGNQQDALVPNTQQESQTASEYIDSQLQLEADAREALPHSFDHCTQPLGPIRQNVYSCITCNPPPDNPSDPYTPAGICYSCSIACHGEHTLVELFARRNFTCDCGTTRLPDDTPCTLRINQATGVKEPVHGQKPSSGNIYNQNYRNRFCGCQEWYDAEKQKGTMYQCLGLSMENGGCGEDWWHPECLMGLPRDWYVTKGTQHAAAVDSTQAESENKLGVGSQDQKGSEDRPEVKDEEEDEHPVPPGFPNEDDFDTLICYKCVQAAPYVKAYGGDNAFLTLKHITPTSAESSKDEAVDEASKVKSPNEAKRKAEDEAEVAPSKKIKHDDVDIESGAAEQGSNGSSPPHSHLLPPPTGVYSMLAKDEDFRLKFCRCKICYPRLSENAQLLEPEETYEPPESEDGEAQGTASVGTGSLLERGEAALSNVDRVRAIEGVMVYNHLKDKVKSFLQPFAESGQAVGAEDIKAYFEKLRGDSENISAAGGAALAGGGNDGADGDSRHEQSGY